MKLYSAKIDDIAKPVAEEPVKEVKEKKPRTEKQQAHYHLIQLPRPHHPRPNLGSACRTHSTLLTRFKR